MGQLKPGANTVSEFTTSLWNPWAMALGWEKVSSQDFGTALSSVPTTRERGSSVICRTGYRQRSWWSADRLKALLDGVYHVPGPGLGTWPATFFLFCALMVGPQSGWGRLASQASSPTPTLSWWRSSRPCEMQLGDRRWWTLDDLELSTSAPSLCQVGTHLDFLDWMFWLTGAQCIRRNNQLKQKQSRNKQDTQVHGLSCPTIWPQCDLGERSFPLGPNSGFLSLWDLVSHLLSLNLSLPNLIRLWWALVAKMDVQCQD